MAGRAEWFKSEVAAGILINAVASRSGDEQFLHLTFKRDKDGRMISRSFNGVANDMPRCLQVGRDGIYNEKKAAKVVKKATLHDLHYPVPPNPLPLPNMNMQQAVQPAIALRGPALAFDQPQPLQAFMPMDYQAPPFPFVDDQFYAPPHHLQNPFPEAFGGQRIANDAIRDRASASAASTGSSKHAMSPMFLRLLFAEAFPPDSTAVFNHEDY